MSGPSPMIPRRDDVAGLPAELECLSSLSSRLGSNERLVQGAGGNTSIKIDEVLWVKASGAWLARASDESIFIPVELASAEEMALRIAAEFPITGVHGKHGDLRPSIETTLHALMPHRVVVHVHSVATIAWAVRSNAEAHLREMLAGISWAFVPYARPGLPLTEAVMTATANGAVDVLVLGNHGLVVGGGDCAGAESLLAEVERRLAVPDRPALPGDPDALAQAIKGSTYRLPIDKSWHSLATDPKSLAVANAGSLYPDHVVFLGPGLARVDRVSDVFYLSGLERPPPVVAVAGRGILIQKGLPVAAEAMIGCLQLVLRQLPDDTAISYLSADQEAELLDWDAEKYRQSLNKRT